MRESVIAAPASLNQATRIAFRDAALAALDALRQEPGGRLVLDLSCTTRMDSSGLGALVVVQLRAAELRIGVLLRGASEEVRFLLLMTRLDERFTFEPPAPA